MSNDPRMEDRAIQKKAEKPNTVLFARLLTSDAVVLAAITFIGYLIAFSYELGFTDEFRIDPALIQIGLDKILLASATVGGVMFFEFYIVARDVWYFSRTAKSSAHYHAFFVFINAIAGAGVIVLLLHGHTRYWVVWAATFCAITIILFVPPLFLKRMKVRSYTERYAKLHQRAHLKYKNSFSSFIDKRFGVALSYLLLFTIVIWVVSIEAGRVKALDERNYSVILDEPNTVLLRQYGDNLITARFDPCTGEITDGIAVRKIPEAGGIRMKQMKIGPLSLKQQSTSEYVE